MDDPARHPCPTYSDLIELIRINEARDDNGLPPLNGDEVRDYHAAVRELRNL